MSIGTTVLKISPVFCEMHRRTSVVVLAPTAWLPIPADVVRLYIHPGVLTLASEARARDARQDQ